MFSLDKGARTRGDLQKLVTCSANSLQVKSELMDVGDDNGAVVDSDNYEYNEDEVFCLTPAKFSKNSNVTSDSSPKVSRVFQDSAAAVQNHLGRGYNAVRAARRAASSLRLLNPTPVKCESVSCGSLVVSGDARVIRTRVVCNLTSRTYLTSSFDIKSGRCISCAGGGHDAFASSGGGPVSFVVADQAFPACLPVWRGGGGVP